VFCGGLGQAGGFNRKVGGTSGREEELGGGARVLGVAMQVRNADTVSNATYEKSGQKRVKLAN